MMVTVRSTKRVQSAVNTDRAASQIQEGIAGPMTGAIRISLCEYLFDHLGQIILIKPLNIAEVLISSYRLDAKTRTIYSIRNFVFDFLLLL